MKERGHAIPRMTAVLEVNAGDAALGGSVFRHPDMQMSQDYHQRLLDVLFTDSPARLFQV